MATRGCVYWDSSSRGPSAPSGRWVAEVVVDGHRERFRSPYLSKCLVYLKTLDKDLARRTPDKDAEQQMYNKMVLAPAKDGLYKEKVRYVKVPGKPYMRKVVERIPVKIAVDLEDQAVREDLSRRIKPDRQSLIRVVSKDDPHLWPCRKGMTMEQRKNRCRQLEQEARLTAEYFESRDFSSINRHVERVVIPQLNAYCRNTIQLRAVEVESAVYGAVAIFYTYLYADCVITNYVRYMSKLLRVYKERGNFGYYDRVPEPVHREVENLDFSDLKTIYKVSKLR